MPSEHLIGRAVPGEGRARQDVGPNDPAGPTTTALSTNDGSTWAADTLPNDVPVLRAVACAASTSMCRAAGTSSIVATGS